MWFMEELMNKGIVTVISEGTDIFLVFIIHYEDIMTWKHSYWRHILRISEFPYQMASKA